MMSYEQQNNKNKSYILCCEISSLIRRKMQTLQYDEVDIMNKTGLTQKQLHFVMNEAQRANLEHVFRVFSALTLQINIY